MDNRILIRSSLARWPFLTYLFAGIFAIILGILFSLNKDQFLLAAVLIGVGIINILVGIVYDANRKKNLMWLTLEPTRFTVTDNIGERTFTDDDVVSMALQVKENFTNGNHTSTTRTFRIWVVAQGDQPELISMVNTNKLAELPPLLPFIDRIVKLFLKRAEEDRLRNLSILGEGWELSSKQLTIRQLPNDLEMPLAEIVAVQPIDGKLKIWREGSDEAVASLPLDAANAHLLYLLMQDHLAARPAAKEPSAGQLGHIVFEKRSPRLLFICFVILAIIQLLISTALFIALFAEKGRNQDTTGIIIGASITLTLGIVFVGLSLMIKRSLFRCHAYGVYQRGISGENTLFFHELHEFTYSATRMYHHGSYIGTIVRLVFIPHPEGGKKKISYGTNVKNADAALEHLRNQVSMQLAQKIVDQVLAGKTVPWTNQLTLEPTGLRYTKITFFSKGEPSFIAYRDISYVAMNQETLSFYQASRPKPFITEQASKKNFYPGYMALQALMAQAKVL